MKKSISKIKISSVFLTLLISTPAIIIFLYLFIGHSDNWQHLKDTLLFTYISNSLYIMIGVAILTGILGFSTAYLTSIYTFKFSKFFHYALILPFAMPTYIVAYIYGGMFNVAGTVTQFVLRVLDKNINEIPFFDIMSIEGAILVMSFVLYPYVYLICKSYLSFESASIIDAAKTFNLSSWQILRKVIIPISRPAIVAGVTLAVMEAVADFGVVDYYGVNTFVTGIFKTWFGMGSINDAAKLASILMTFVFLLIILERIQRKNKVFKSSGKDFKPINKVKLTGFKSFLAFSVCFIPFFFGFLLPFIQMTYWFAITYKDIIDEEFIKILYQTLTLAIISATIITAMALLFVYNIRKNKDKSSSVLTQIVKLGYSIPGAVIAVGILSFFSFLDKYVIDFFTSSYIISGTILAIIFGYCVRFLAIGINNFEAGFSRIPHTYDDAAKMLNVNERRTFFTIFAPLLKNSAFSAFIIVFIEVIKELPLTMILRPFNYDTLAILALELTQQSQFAESSVPSMFILLIGMISVLLLAKNMNKA
ncbi:ABC transporter permease [Malaciobacter molluscorum LMG 25693]|uniref:ABC transporter permease n=1 Tax=Malaciobacter molluscorum LMG 25693 TaxID=870501 RepID=A0A2G1DHX5_9BACT|nr:iron ABC transporter permease [Malaciobacter molluscorum]AXX93288.1 iron(III)/spermidine/putrescine ABC transporter, permease protein [Malaciobacter molluscorum LMG 25693]PHO17946.1 ABC transporter permease [Malaciobacter molluscorum LMG 25693]